MSKYLIIEFWSIEIKYTYIVIINDKINYENLNSYAYNEKNYFFLFKQMGFSELLSHYTYLMKPNLSMGFQVMLIP